MKWTNSVKETSVKIYSERNRQFEYRSLSIKEIESETREPPVSAGSARGRRPALGSRRGEAERPGPGAARAALVAAAGRCSARGAGRPGGWGASRRGRVPPAGAPAAATGAGPPRDRPQSRCA